MNTWSPSCLRKTAWSLRASQGRRKVGFRAPRVFCILGDEKKDTSVFLAEGGLAE